MRRHSRPCRHASCSTHSSSWVMRPTSSATSRNSPGPTSPRSGCCQRTSASKPTTGDWPATRSAGTRRGTRRARPPGADRSRAAAAVPPRRGARRRTPSSRRRRRSCAVHGQVGVADDVLARLVGVGGHGHADAGAGEHVLAVDRQRQHRHLLHPLGDADGIHRLADAVEQHRELVAAEAGERRLGDAPGVGHARDDVVAAHGAARRSPNMTSRRSPAVWPRLSLTCLKRSRSTNSTAN